MIAPIIALVMCLLLVRNDSAWALDAVEVPLATDALDLTRVTDFVADQQGRIQTPTAPGLDGIVQRIEVTATNPENSNWLVFALSNPSDQQIDRLIVAPHFRLVGSGVLRPDLGAQRLVAITPNSGFALNRELSEDADVFRVTIDPGTIVTYVAELSSDRVPQLYLWEPDAYKDSVNSYTLYKGIVLGIAGLLALFLTIIFVVKGTIMFPATAALAWVVLGYLCIDFGFWDQVFHGDTSTEPLYRAGSEALLCATLVFFLYGYLNLNRWHQVFNVTTLILGLAMIALFVVSLLQPTVAATGARFMLGVIGIGGLVLIGFFSFKGYDRAIMLIPSWILLLIWLVGAFLTVNGNLSNDIVQPALGGGLVLIVLLIGFTVVQHAFAGGSIAQGAAGDTERKALAFLGSGDYLWDWDATRDRISTSAEIEDVLGLSAGALEGSPRHWMEVLHPQDRERFRSVMDAILEHRRGRINQTFRLRATDGHYRWLNLRARPVIGSDGEVIRCVGTLNDVTEFRVVEERLLHDAVHDNLTGLPNRRIYFDRLENAITRAKMEGARRPAVILVDLDRMRSLNDRLGLSVGDSVLLTIGRRLSRILKPQDTAARIGRDQFALILVSEQEPERIAAFADGLRRSIRTPINFGDQDITLSASIGVAMFDSSGRGPEEMHHDAELAMTRAKNLGGDRIEAFRTHMRQFESDATILESDLANAVKNNELVVLYQPIVRLSDRSIAGFEALVRWDHPRFGRILPQEFIPLAERNDLIFHVGTYVMDRAARDIAAIHQTISTADPVFISINVSSRQVLRHDLINEVKGVLTRTNIDPTTFKLELTESLMLENPEFSAIVMARIKDLGASLALDDFGTGYASLGYLQRLPFDTLKIDKTFVSEKAGDRRPIILRSIVNMAQELGMQVIAEGAESEAEAIELAQIGCEFAQGYLFGQPMSANDALNLVGRQSKLAAE